MTARSATDICRRSDAAWEIKSRSDAIVEEAMAYALPGKLHPIKGGGAGNVPNNFAYDSTAMSSVAAFANRLQENLTPLFDKWFELSPGPLVPTAQHEELKRVLEPIGDKLRAVLSRPQFHTASHEMYQDLTMGRGCLLVLEGNDNDIVNFVAVDQSEVALEDGPYGDVEGRYRKVEVPAENIPVIWPDADVPEEIKELLEDDEKRTGKVFLTEATYLDRAENLWRYEVVLKTAKDNDSKKAGDKIVSRTSQTSPWVTPRWLKMKGDPNGIGQLQLALPDIRTLNKVVEMELQNAALAISGIYTVVDGGVTNTDTVRLGPGMFVSVRSNGGALGPSIQALETGRNFEISQILIEKLQVAIKRLLLDNSLPPEAGAVRSATEIVQRMRELFQQIGGPFARLLSEFIVPLLNRVLEILHKKGLIEVPAKIDPLFVKVDVLSPLARANDLTEVEATLRWLETIEMTGGKEAMLIFAEMETIYPAIGPMLGVPMRFIRKEQDRNKVQQQFATLVAANMNTPPVEPGVSVPPVQQAA